jgi:site-specific DNA recombinase
MRVHCATQGHAVIAVMREVHTGQELWERPVLTEIRDMIRRGEVDVLVAYSVDRLARDPVHLGVILCEAEHYGCDVEFATETVARTPEAMFLLQAKGFAAKIEAVVFAERTMRARVARVKGGRLQGQGGACYGYQHDKVTATRTVIEHEAVIVREIYRWAASGLGATRIARRLNDRDVSSPAVTRKRLSFVPRWSIRTVQEILKNPAYKGEMSSFRYKRSKAAKRSVLRPTDEWIAMPDGVCPALVTTELWEMVQRQRQRNRGATARNEQRPFLLRELVRCGVCRRACSPQLSHGRRVYRCCSRHTSAGACGARTISADLLERWVWDELSERLRRPETIVAQVERLREQDETSLFAHDLEAAQRALSAVLTRQDRLVARSLDDDPDFPIDIIKGQLGRLRQEREQLEAEVARLAQRQAEQQAARAYLSQVGAVCREIAPYLESLDFDKRRRVLLTLDVEVVASGRDWRLRGGIPLEGEPLIEAASGEGGVPTRPAHKSRRNATLLDGLGDGRLWFSIASRRDVGEHLAPELIP